LDEGEIENARLRLEALPNVRAVQVHLIKGSRKQWVVVVIEVTEINPLTSAFAAGSLLQIGQPDTRLQTLAGRLTDHDLFGSGKVLDLALIGAWFIGGGGGGEYAARLEYVDPQLFDSRRYFLTIGGFYSRTSYNFSIPPYVAAGGYSNSGAGFDFSVGMHLDTYTYVTVGYRYLYLQNTSANNQYLTSDGVITTLSSSPGSVALFTIGRNTEDDPFFPTHGWLLHGYAALAANLHSNFAGIVVRGTWRAGNDAFWTFQARPFDDFRSLFDDDLKVSIVYSHALFADTQTGAARRARWFIGPGVDDLRHSLGPHYYEAGIKGGVRLETKYFGTVNLYVIATHLVRNGY
jgi:outer membrane protein assembly factor BamA